jgi:hypothetical protein
MLKNKKAELIFKRCEILEAHGFTINHEDSSVSIGEFTFDFSGIELTTENIIKVVADKAYSSGFEKGQKDIRQKFKQLIDA